ncbi:FxSxx-COOH system tetratricopeptide repeat protein [Streptomyces sp. NPDC005263]|uniref:FxSxx-COOH system tetratricopeptide repeat protein n=1 Tax=Streptomyces sp. NPDC005263 TaxID=3364711 RepID=UPI0036BAA57D
MTASDQQGTWQEVLQSGNATAHPGGVAVSGIYNLNLNVPLEALRPPAEVDARPGLDDLPYLPPHFVGREGELDRLDAALRRPGTALVQAVHGLGGIGKSSLAAYWAANRAHGHAPIRWITADSFGSVQQGLADFATALQLPLARAMPVEALAEYALEWLSTHHGWLLILDNVNDPADIARLIARAPGGRFLITSRLATVWSDAATLVPLGILEPDESLTLLADIVTGAGPRDMDGAVELCEELGHLPIAVQQAAAYLAQNPFITPRAYLQLLAESPAMMYRHGAATARAEHTIDRIWNITLDRINSLQPQAADLLRTLAWYAPEHIPVSLLDGFADPATLSTALGLLSTYSMIAPDPAVGTLAIHRLVQGVARTPDTDIPHRTPDLIAQARNRATALLSAAQPNDFEDPDTWPRWRALLPHIDALADHAAEITDTAATEAVLTGAGGFLENQGLTARATRHVQRALSYSVRELGEDHPDTLAARNNLASAYRSAGDLQNAVPLLERVLADAERLLGQDDPSTLAYRNNLAYTYQSTYDLRRAASLFEQNLDLAPQVLGEDHRITLKARAGLAVIAWSEKDLPLAVSLFTKVLEDSVRVLGEDHQETLSLRNHLVYALESSGDSQGAASMSEQNLNHTIRVLGRDHPDTLRARGGYASVLRSMGEVERAGAVFEHNLAERIRLLGEDHPDTVTARGNLAVTVEMTGDLRRAITLYEQTVTDAARVLGKQHRFTATIRDRLTMLRKRKGRARSG